MTHITPWEERKYVGGLVRNNEECMFEEINELRAAVAQEAPSVPDGYIRFDYINSDGREDSKVITHDEMRDRYAQHYRAAYANFAAPSAPSPDHLQELADQAQELDMGYGPNACPTCGKSAPSVIADARDAERYRWLRSLSGSSAQGDMVVMLTKRRPEPYGWKVDSVRGERLDEAIDAAIATQPKEGQP